LSKTNDSPKKLIKKLQECTTLGQADPILAKLGARPAVKKLVETAIILATSPDEQQRNHAFGFMRTAIKELEDDIHKLDEESPMGQHSGEDGLNTPKIGAGDGTINEEEDDKKDKETNAENKIHEEELSNHNQGPRTDGSEQSTDNTQPYPGEGTDSADGEKDMQKMDGTVNQWNETGGMPPPPGGGAPPPQQGGGMPPQQPPQQQMGGPPPGAGGMIMPGLAPNIAQEMGLGMQPLPPMNTGQAIEQMQYTIKEYINDYHKRIVAPNYERLSATINKQRETLSAQTNLLTQQRDAIKTLSHEIQETKAASGNLKFDLDYMRNNANATFRDSTTNPLAETRQFFDDPSMPSVLPVNHRADHLATARAEIDAMDKLLNSGNKSIYN